MKPFSPPDFRSRVFYFIVRSLYKIAFRLIWRLEISGEENVPRSGGVLLAANHTSYADPPLMAACVYRSVYFFAKEELFQVPILGWAIRHLNAFPVKRYEHDVGAFKRAQVLLQNGQVVLLFPEGQRNKTGELGKAKAGVAMLAFKAHVPVVPVAFLNSNQLGKFKKLKVAFGKPMLPEDRQTKDKEYQPFADAVIAAIANLLSKM